MLTDSTQTTDYEAEILYWMVVSLDAFGSAILRNDKHLDRWANLPDAPCRLHGPRYDPTTWRTEQGPPTPADRQGFSCAAQSLEAAGLVVLVRQHGKRVSHVRPTPLGLRVALTLAPEADLAAIAKAIKTAAWGTAAHLATIKTSKKGRSITS
jgi:hypothetical protein